MTPYIRTFQHDKKFEQNCVAIDFTKIETIFDDGKVVFIWFVSGETVAFGGNDRLVFLEAFAEYARDMQSLERGPVSFKPMVDPEFSKPKAPDETH